MSSIRSIGGAAGAEFPPRDETDSVERQIVLTARPALDALADYMLGLARQIITPRGRGNIGFDQPVPVSDDVSVLDRLIASPAGNR
jgi:hypothetical protein